jgi:hypothetical protein
LQYELSRDPVLGGFRDAIPLDACAAFAHEDSRSTLHTILDVHIIVPVRPHNMYQYQQSNEHKFSTSIP